MNKTAITTLNVTLSVNGANAPNQKTEWLNGYKNKETPFKSKNTRQKVKGWKKVFYVNGNEAKFSSVAQSCLTLCNRMNRSTPGLPVHHQLPEFTQTHVH